MAGRAPRRRRRPRRDAARADDARSRTADLAELVCSNACAATRSTSASGLLKEEMRRLGSLVVTVRRRVAVPAGSALAVDRALFAPAHDRGRRGDAARRDPPRGGARASPTARCDRRHRAAHLGTVAADAAALRRRRAPATSTMPSSPIVAADCIDREKVFLASRYDKGDDDYINCPISRDAVRGLLPGPGRRPRCRCTPTSTRASCSTAACRSRSSPRADRTPCASGR